MNRFGRICRTLARERSLSPFFWTRGGSMSIKKSSIKKISGPLSTKVKGKLAERWVAVVLWLHGWRLLATNLKTPEAEIDLVCDDGSGMVIVEVKYRTNYWGRPLTNAQLNRLARAAEALQTRLRTPPGSLRQGVRIDLILLVRCGCRIRWHHYRGLAPHSKLGLKAWHSSAT